MNTQHGTPTHDAAERIWLAIAEVRKAHSANRLFLGKLFWELRNLYSERSNSADRRLSSGHGTFQTEIVDRGYKPNRVREWIVDFEVASGLRPPAESTAAKRKARRQPSAEYSKGYRAAMDAVGNPCDPVTRFANLLPYAALKSAFRTALHELHPDHGGSAERTRELIAAWEELARLHTTLESDVSAFEHVH